MACSSGCANCDLLLKRVDSLIRENLELNELRTRERLRFLNHMQTEFTGSMGHDESRMLHATQTDVHDLVDLLRRLVLEYPDIANSQLIRAVPAGKFLLE